MKRLALSTALFLMISMQANATSMIGIGTKTCGFYNEKIKGTSAEVYYESWAVGFLSAMNIFTYKFDILKTTDAEAITGAYKQYCADHPLDQFAIAVLNVATQLAERAAPPELKTGKK